jgi:hypothetical protein
MPFHLMESCIALHRQFVFLHQSTPKASSATYDINNQLTMKCAIQMTHKSVTSVHNQHKLIKEKDTSLQTCVCTCATSTLLNKYIIPKKHVGDKELKLKRQCCNINEFHTPLLPPWRNFATSKKLLQTETFTCIPI